MANRKMKRVTIRSRKPCTYIGSRCRRRKQNRSALLDEMKPRCTSS
jgi:hypothetical protein